MRKIAGSGSIGHRHGSADPDPDPHQNAMDPQHCSVVDPDPHGSPFVWLCWIRIRIGNAGPEPDPGPAFPKPTKIY